MVGVVAKGSFGMANFVKRGLGRPTADVFSLFLL